MRGRRLLLRRMRIHWETVEDFRYAAKRLVARKHRQRVQRQLREKRSAAAFKRRSLSLEV